MPGISIEISDLNNLVGWNITTETRPNIDAVNALISESITLVEGALKSRGIVTPIDTDQSPNAAAIISHEVKQYVAARVQRAHYRPLDNVSISFHKDLRAAENKFNNLILIFCAQAAPTRCVRGRLLLKASRLCAEALRRAEARS